MDLPFIVLTYMQIVSLKVRNHTIIKSWSSIAARAPFNSYYQHWVRKIGGKTLFSTHDQDFYQTHYIFQLYPSITFNVRLVGVYWTLDSWAGRRLGILIRLSLLWNWSGSFLGLVGPYNTRRGRSAPKLFPFLLNSWGEWLAQKWTYN